MLTAIIAFAGLMFLLATVLVIAHKKFYVEQDPRIDQVEDRLPHVNCGACGFAGCHAFAEALVMGRSLPGQCTVSSPEELQGIADLLGVEVGVQVRRVARLACAGGDNVTRYRAQYQGLANCRAAALIGGGGKSCAWGCLGLGDCAEVCQFAAIQMNAQALPVVNEDQCTACGDCVEICPKDLFSLQAIEHRLWVACKNQQAGDVITQYCQVACTACGRCVIDAPSGLMQMQDNLPVINYTQDHPTQVPIQRCPTGAIVWLLDNGEVIKGLSAKKIIRKLPLEMLPT